MTTPAPRHPPLWLRLGAMLFAVALRLLGATWRVRFSGSHPLESAAADIASDHAPIRIAWHSGAIAFAYAFRARNIAIGVSRSRDGDAASAVLARLGFAPPVRGSTSSGGAEALRRLISRVEDGGTIGLLVDGPRGPAERSKPGAAALARRTGRPVVPIGCAARPAFRFGSWDRTLLPLPFARVVVHFGEPVHLGEHAAENDSASLDLALEAAQSAAAGALDETVSRA